VTGGSVDVIVTTTETGPVPSADNVDDLFAYGPPSVTGLAPGAGPITGGTVVTVIGTSFAPDATVSFGTTAATRVTVTSATTLQATTPAAMHGGSVNVTVTQPGSYGGTSATSSSDLYAYGAPTVTAIAPATGPPDSTTFVTITGTGFSFGDTVHFGATPASGVTVVSPTVITTSSPATLEGDAPVAVTNALATSPPSVAAQFAASAPTVTAISPSAGPSGGGKLVTVTGEGFVAGASVAFGGLAATGVTVLSPTSLTATAPPGPTGAVDVKVTTPKGTSGTSMADLYAYGAPTVTAVAPDTGPVTGGSDVTVTGSGFVPGVVVSFGSAPATGVTPNATGTSLQAIAPAEAAGSVDVTVTDAAGTSTRSIHDLYANGAPVVTSVAPGAGPPAGGNDVIVAGSGFVPGMAVYFGAQKSSSVTVLPGGMGFYALAPAGTAGSVDITARTLQGTSVTSFEDAYFYGGPAVTGISPATGSKAGGTVVTITGTGFVPGSIVTFGLQRATSATVTSSTSITAVAPAAGPGAIPVRVSTPVGLSPVTLADSFVYDDQPHVPSGRPPASRAT
jgi:hypothetical protein